MEFSVLSTAQGHLRTKREREERDREKRVRERKRERERRERESERERASVCLCASGRRIGGCKHSLIIREEGGGVGGEGETKKK